MAGITQKKDISSPTKSTTSLPSSGENGNFLEGFSNIIRKASIRKKVTSRKTKKDEKKNTPVNNRRVVKATQPPKISPVEQLPNGDNTNNINHEDSSSSNRKMNDTKNSGDGTSSEQQQDEKSNLEIRGGKVKDVEDELRRENSIKWRQDRLDASAIVRKEQKEKEITEHRQKEQDNTTKADDSTQKKIKKY